MLLILFMAQYRANGTVRSYLHLKTDLLCYSIFLQNLRARISPPWSARSYINLESSPYFPVSTWIGFAYYIVLLRDETSSSVFCLSWCDVKNHQLNSRSHLHHLSWGIKWTWLFVFGPEKGQLISIDEGHLFMRCICSPNCFLKDNPVGFKSILCMIDFSNSSYKTPTYLFKFKHWRVDCFSPVTFEGRNDHVKDLADFSEHLCSIR